MLKCLSGLGCRSGRPREASRYGADDSTISTFRSAARSVGSAYGGPVVTAVGLIFIGATPDRKFRGYDVQNGDLLWQADLPAAAFTTPATCSVDGTQYVVIAAGGGRMGPPSGSEYLAYRQPSPSP